jgi:hypothetical protein
MGRPPEQPDLLNQYGAAQQIAQRAQAFPGQMQAQQLANQQAGQQVQLTQQQMSDAKIYMNSLSKTGDFDKALDDAAQNGLSGMGYMNYGQMALQRRALTTKLNSDQLDVASKLGNQLSGELEGFKKLSPDEQTAQWPTIRQRVLGFAPGLQNVLPQNVPSADQVDAYEANLMGEKNLIDQRLAATKEPEAKTSANRLAAEMPGGPLSAGSQAAQRMPYEIQKDIAVATNPQIQAGKVQVATAEGQARANIEAQMARGSQAALANVPPHLIGPATQAASKAGQDYAQAQQAADDMNSMITLARQGNKVAYSYAPVTGVLQINVAGETKRINVNEIEAYGGAGSALDRVKAFIGKQASGASIPDNILNDMGSVSQSYVNNAGTKYQRDLGVINQTYGANFRPIGTQTRQNLPPVQKGFTRITASDGSIHDIPSGNLAQAQKIDPGLQVTQ